MKYKCMTCKTQYEKPSGGYTLMGAFGPEVVPQKCPKCDAWHSNSIYVLETKEGVEIGVDC